MATKFVYTATDVTEITAKYADGITLETLAADYNKSVASVRMKLVHLGVYKKAEKPPSTPKSKTTVEKTAFPTTKSGILELYNRCLAAVGPAPF